MQSKKSIWLIILAVIALYGCAASSDLEATGKVLLQVSVAGDSSRFSTISPELDIEQYIIDFEMYNGSASEKESIVLTSGESEITLSVGNWTISIHAEDSEGVVLAETTIENIEVTKYEINEVYAILQPVSGTGSISITLDLINKPDNVTIDSVEYTLYKGISTPVEIDTGFIEYPYLLSMNCESGTDYRLVFEITTDADVIISEGAVHVFTGETTIDTIVLPAGDFIVNEINTDPPEVTERLVFIHHSCGNNWLDTGNGNLGNTLGENNYYVRDTYYGWDALYNTDIGSHTDTDSWYYWFLDESTEAVEITSMYGTTTLETQDNGIPRRDNIMDSLYSTDNKHASYTPITDPVGENDIIMFKSCYPLSEVGASIDDEKAIYNDLLDYFVQRQDKLFILVTPPGETEVSSYLLTKELCQWLVDEETGWLSGYAHNNVGVFDFYCVLSEIDSHHTVENGEIIYTYSPDYDGTSPYHEGDDHPNSTGNQKSTDEFVPLLNYYYNRWKNN